MSRDGLNADKKAIELAKQLEINISDIKKDGKVTKKDVEEYYKSLSDARTEEGQDPEPEKAPDDVQPIAPIAQEAHKEEIKGKLVCVFNIKEDGKTYLAGEEYKGKNAKYLLGRKSIKRA